MSDNNQNRGPQVVQFFQPVIDALMELGGSGQPSKVKEIIANRLSIPSDEQAEQISISMLYTRKMDLAINTLPLNKKFK